MNLPQIAALVAVAVLALVIVFQLLLAAGLPLGHAAWGGRYRVLPPTLRWGSAAAVPILSLAALAILARAGLIPPGPQPLAVRVLAWVFAAFFTLNTLGNLGSRSATERKLMTPATLLLVACFLTVALAR